MMTDTWKETFITEPPEKYKTRRHHWLHAERAGNPGIAEWWPDGWYSVNEKGPVTPHEMRCRGWEYLGPVTHRPKSKYLDNG